MKPEGKGDTVRVGATGVAHAGPGVGGGRGSAKLRFQAKRRSSAAMSGMGGRRRSSAANGGTSGGAGLAEQLTAPAVSSTAAPLGAGALVDRPGEGLPEAVAHSRKVEEDIEEDDVEEYDDDDDNENVGIASPVRGFRHGAAAAASFFGDLPPEFAGLAALGGDAGLGYPGGLGGYEEGLFSGIEPGSRLPSRLMSYNMMDQR